LPLRSNSAYLYHAFIIFTGLKPKTMIERLKIALSNGFITVAAIGLLSACGGGQRPKDQSVETQVQETEVSASGQELYMRHDCNACHSLSGQDMIGPALNGLYGNKVKVIRDGELMEVTADREYLKKSILDPEYEYTDGFEDIPMPIPELSDGEVEALIDFIIASDKD